ncbi:hypothetical protein F4809DRAFT_604497 [Biscogniauxia mediterranea]|nr:hypothetical protein F4809DRAFT_604497 [Biscogniauxia mediterranea]
MTLCIFTPLCLRSNVPITGRGRSLLTPQDYDSIQTDPRFWGPESLSWRPSRWIKAGKPEIEELNIPLHSAFLAS